MNIIEDLIVCYEKKFTANEKKIAEIIIKEKIILDLTIKELAQKTYTSEAAIIRFSKKLNFTGYKEFQFYVQYNSKENLSIQASDIVYSQYKEIIGDFLDENIDQKIKNLIKSINKSNNIYVIGKGSSTYTTQEICLRMQRIGYKFFSYTNNVDIDFLSNIIEANDMVLIVSYNGNNKQIIGNLENQVYNCKKILLTTNEHAKIANYIEETILVNKVKTKGLRINTSPQIPFLYFFDIMYTKILLENKNIKKYDKIKILH